MSESLIKKNGYGVIGLITSHGYLKSGSFRGLRFHLMSNFDEIMIVDLHGNSEIREIVPDGRTDQNVFDIKQGVSMIVAFRKQSHEDGKLARVQYAEFWGAREEKYAALNAEDISSTDWIDCNPAAPNYTFHPSGANVSEYMEKCFPINELFSVYSSGVITARDDFVISESVEKLLENALEFSQNQDLDDPSLCEKLGIAQKKGWDVAATIYLT